MPRNVEAAEPTLELEPTPKKIGVLAPGQAVAPEAFKAQYEFLMQKNPRLVTEYLKESQDALDETYEGNTPFQIAEIIGNPEHPAYKNENSGTAAVQPVTFALSVITFMAFEKKLQEMGKIQRTGGLSVGQVAGAVIGRVFGASLRIGYGTGARITAYRGKVMQEAYLKNPSTLLTIRRGTPEVNQKIIETFPETYEGLNTAPGLTLLGTSEEQVAAIGLWVKEQDPKMAVTDFKTAGAYHTPYEEEARKQLERYLETVEFCDPAIPLISNVNGELITTAQGVNDDLVVSMAKTVQFVRFMETLRKDVDMVIEVGPGKSVSELAKRNGLEDATPAADLPTGR